MWTCAELKSRAKSILARTYWTDVVAVLIYIGIAVGVSIACRILLNIILTVTSFSVLLPDIWSYYPKGFGYNYGYLNGFFIEAVSFSGILMTIIELAASIFLLNPLMVGLYRFFVVGRQRISTYETVFFAFKHVSYPKIVVSALWLMLFSMLWAIPAYVSIILLALLPFLGIGFYLKLGLTVVLSIILVGSTVLLVYKLVSYSMTLFILSDSPAIGYQRALKLSIQMTRGHVLHIVGLGLSFIGWILLLPLTCFIGIIFLWPYICATFTELYARLRDNALRARVCSFAELGFNEPDPSFYSN